MKKYLYMMGAWVALTAITTVGQTSSSGGSQSTSGSTQGTSTSQGTTSSSQGNQQNLPPGLQNRDQLPPGLQNRDQLPPGLAKRTNNVSNFSSTNQFGGTSRFGTNNSGLYPTGRSGETNRNYGTNGGFRGGSSYGTNNSPYGGQRDRYGENNREGRERHQDQAVTAQDRTLLITVRQRVQTEVRELISSAGAWAPVNFSINNGVVTIFGTVQTIEIKQKVEGCVRRVPGVVRVEDSIEVAGAGGAVGGGDADQVLVTRVRERVLPQIQVSGIDFQCHNGVVTVIGSVPQPEVRERLVTLVRQVPGVVNVTDQITVGAEVQGQSRLDRPEQSRQGQPEETRAGESERQRAVSAGIETSRTNLPPTGRENSLPPGLEKKDQLPPGLQNRDELPPGLSRRTNDSSKPNP